MNVDGRFNIKGELNPTNFFGRNTPEIVAKSFVT